MTVYGARYPKKMKEKLKEKLKKYKTLKTLQPSKLTLPEEFPSCYSNNNLCEAVSSILFSLRNERNAIIVGEDESGITQVARWCAECFNYTDYIEESREEEKKEEEENGKEKEEEENGKETISLFKFFILFIKFKLLFS